MEVPAELKLGFRDEMEQAKAKATAGSTGGPEAEAAKNDDADTAHLAEGFVQTAPEPAPAAAPAYPPARPAQGVPQPTRTIPLPQPVPQPVTQRPRNGDANAGVPVWIDYAIVAMVGLLIAMLVKILLGY